MHEVLHLIYKNRDKIWRNYMTHTTDNFKHNWCQGKQWRIPNSYNLEVTTFIKHLIIELNTVDKNLVLSLLKFSQKKQIDYLTTECRKFLYGKTQYGHEPTKQKEIIFITSSCFSPPEPTLYESWQNGNHVQSLDDILLENKPYAIPLFLPKTNLLPIQSKNRYSEEDLLDVELMFSFDEEIFQQCQQIHA